MKRFRPQKYKWTILYAAFSLLCCFFFSTGTAMDARAAESPNGKRTVRIPCGINSLLYFDEDGNVAGYCKDYLDSLAKINNWKYEYVETTWSEAVTMLDTGELDILFPTSITPEREETMDFSSMVGGYTAPGLFARKDSELGYDDYEGFDGARIAVTQNSSNETALSTFAKEHQFSYEAVYLGTTEEKAAALADGTVDLVAFGASNEIPGAKLVSVLDADPFYYAVKKGSASLLSELNDGMQELLLRDADLVTQTLADCLAGANGNQTAFTKDEQAFVTDKTKITVGFYRQTEPLAYVDSDGTCHGIYIDLMEKMADAGLTIELYPIDRQTFWQDLVTDGTIDFYIGAADMSDLDESRFLPTSSFMDYETVLITQNDYELLHDADITIALTNGRSYWENGLSAYFENVQILYCGTARDCLLAVKNGDADATLLNTIEYNYQSKNVRFSDLVQWENYRSKSGAVMVASADVDSTMYSVMDKALGTLDDSTVNDVINANLNIAYRNLGFTDYLYPARYFLISAALILVMALIVFLIYCRTRKKQEILQEKAREHEKEQLRIMAALSLDYASIYYVYLDEDRFTIVELTSKLRGEVADMARQSQVFSERIELYIDMFVLPEYQETIRNLVKKETLLERFREEKDFVVRYQVKPNDAGQEFFEMHFVDVSENESEHMMVLGFRCVDNIAREEIAQKKALKEAFDAANSANHAKSDFLSKMSHDIRTPMNAIIGMTAIAGAHIDDKERVQDALGKITSSSRHLLALINEVLDMSKIESGQIEMTEEEFNLSDLLNNLLLMVQPQIAQYGHELQVHILNIEHEDVIGDSLRIQQVFVNIMGNAIKYTPNNGHICLTVQEKPFHEQRYGCYEFIFEDDGIGMTEEYLEHIFEPFSRAEDVRTSKVQGTGLGMAITQNIVQMMNGSINVESEPGKGSKFIVTIFLKLQETPDIDVAELAGLPVLVADDDRISCESTCQMLGDIGMEGEWVLSGQEAVQRVEEVHQADRDFYAVILDWKMPGMDGVETAKAIKKVAGPNVPVIIISAYDWSDIELEAKAAGVDAFLSKPVFKSGLVRMFKNIKNGEKAETSKQVLDEVMESDYSGRRALLVEDNELNREIAREILEMTGMEVEDAENGREAVDKFLASARGYYDVIFMDVQMPVMNGYDATAAIRSLGRADASRVPIIAMTANAFAEDVQAAKSAGMNEHLAKPLDFDKLTDVLGKYLG